VNLRLNGEPAEFVDGTDLASVVAVLSCAGRGVAVAVNGEVVPRSLWSTTTLRAGDAVEVLTAAQGG